MSCLNIYVEHTHSQHKRTLYLNLLPYINTHSVCRLQCHVCIYALKTHSRPHTYTPFYTHRHKKTHRFFLNGFLWDTGLKRAVRIHKRTVHICHKSGNIRKKSHTSPENPRVFCKRAVYIRKRTVYIRQKANNIRQKKRIYPQKSLTYLQNAVCSRKKATCISRKTVYICKRAFHIRKRGLYTL